jgi:photosystem II stability/assembly factor-like uncharacterized protein
MYKKVLISIALLFCSSSLLFSQWTALTSPTSSDLKGIYCSSDAICYAVGVSGKAYKTTNSGANWTIMSLGTTTNLHGIRFVGNSTGFILAGDAIYKTINAGAAWNKSYIYNYSETAGGFDMYGGLGVAACADETTPTVGPARTVNSGSTWTSFGTFSSVFSNQALYGCDVVNATTVVMVGGNAGSNKNLFLSANGGQSWTDKSFVTGVLRAVHFGDANTGYAVGESGIVLKTTDGGQTWAKKIFPTNDNLYACWFISPTVGFVGTAGKIYKTIDGGTNWTVSATITGNKKIYSLYFPLSNVGYAVGEGGVAYRYYVNTTAIETELDTANWQIFPNPAQDEVHFSMTDFASMGTDLHFSIWNHLGQKVKELALIQGEQTISVADLPSGMYFVIVENDKKRMVKKLIKA